MRKLIAVAFVLGLLAAYGCTKGMAPMEKAPEKATEKPAAVEKAPMPTTTLPPAPAQEPKPAAPAQAPAEEEGK